LKDAINLSIVKTDLQCLWQLRLELKHSELFLAMYIFKSKILNFYAARLFVSFYWVSSR